MESNRTKAKEENGTRQNVPPAVNPESIDSNGDPNNMLDHKASLVEFDKDIWTVEGPLVDFFGIPYPTRMVIIRLSNNTSWIWSPIEYSEPLLQEIELKAGPVRHLVSPNMIHWLFLKPWQNHCP